MCRIKYSKQTSKNQASKKINPELLAEITPHNLSLYLSTCPVSVVRVLNVLIDLSNKHKQVYATQDKIAEWAKIHNKSVYNALHELREKKIIRTESQGHKRSLLYYVNHDLFTPQLRSWARYILPALQFISLLYLNCQTVPMRATNLNLFNISSTVKYYNHKRVYSSKRRVMKPVPFEEVRGENPATYEQLISPTIRSIESVKLTRAGEVWLTPFPDSVIKTIDQRLLRCGAADPFAYLFGSCVLECKKQNIQPNWKKRSHFIKLFHIEETAQKIIESHVPFATRKKAQLVSFKEIDTKKYIKAKDNEGNEVTVRRRYEVFDGIQQKSVSQTVESLRAKLSDPKTVAFMKEIGNYEQACKRLEELERELFPNNGNAILLL